MARRRAVACAPRVVWHQWKSGRATQAQPWPEDGEVMRWRLGDRFSRAAAMERWTGWIRSLGRPGKGD